MHMNLYLQSNFPCPLHHLEILLSTFHSCTIILLLKDLETTYKMTIVIYDRSHLYVRGENMLREARKKTTKERIVHHSIQLFKEKGYDKVTVEEITTVCGIAKGTFFNYFRKKEHVLLHVSNSYMSLMDKIIHKHREARTKERLQHIFRDLIAIYLQHSDLLSLTLVETIKSAVEANEEASNFKIFQDELSAMIEADMAKGFLHTRWDPDLIASVISGIFFDTLINSSSDLNEQAIMGILLQKLDMIWEGIAGE